MKNGCKQSTRKLAAILLLKQLLNPLKECVRHIAERKVKQCCGSDYRTMVREHLERFLAMVSRHARCTHTTERQLLVGNVHNGIVDASTPDELCFSTLRMFCLLSLK